MYRIRIKESIKSVFFFEEFHNFSQKNDTRIEICNAKIKTTFMLNMCMLIKCLIFRARIHMLNQPKKYRHNNLPLKPQRNMH